MEADETEEEKAERIREKEKDDKINPKFMKKVEPEADQEQNTKKEIKISHPKLVSYLK